VSVATLRVVTLNMWGEQPPLDERMALIEAGIRELRPDVVALQEVRQIEGKLPNQAQTLGERCGYRWVYAKGTSWGGGDEGVAVLSRHAIGEYESMVLPASTPEETRVVLMARIDAPQGSVRVYTTHLNYRLTHGLLREQQVVAIDDFVKAHASEAPQILTGDFNATPEHDEIRFLRGLHTMAGRRVFYQDAYARRHPVETEAGFTWSRRNPFTERLRWLERDRRIDYIFVTPIARDGRGVVHECQIVYDRPDAHGNYASDHFGVMADIQIQPIAAS
jgi:endonuclease/exonuclease/phosphatase family metal-dependent hydrolase